MSKLPLVISLLALNVCVWSEEPPKPAGTAEVKEEAWKTELRAKLKKPVSFEFVDTPLGDALKFVGSQLHVTIILDPAAGAEKKAINMRVLDMELEHALKWTTQLSGLEYTLQDGAIFVTDPAHKPQPVEMCIYDVTDLTAKAATGAAALSDLIRTQIQPDSWDAARGTSIEERNGRLVIMQTAEVHNLIDAMLRSKRGLPPATAVVPDETWKKEIRKKLLAKVSFEFVDTPLTDAVDFLRRKGDVTIVLDPKLIADKPPVINLKVTDMNLDVALDWVTKLIEAEYRLQDGAIFITSQKPAPAENPGRPIVPEKPKPKDDAF